MCLKVLKAKAWIGNKELLPYLFVPSGTIFIFPSSIWSAQLQCRLNQILSTNSSIALRISLKPRVSSGLSLSSFCFELPIQLTKATAQIA